MTKNDSVSDANADALQANIDAVVHLQLAIMQKVASQRGQPPKLRGQHPKQHGCVQAQFEVLADIPDRFKVGLFAKPATYTAYVRFSNGKNEDDTQPDVHGMAVKLTGVPGRKILDGEAEATTHDFILADNPVFFIRTADEYVQFVRSVAESAPKLPEKFIAWLQQHRPEDVPVLKSFLGDVVKRAHLARATGARCPTLSGPATARSAATPPSRTRAISSAKSPRTKSARPGVALTI